MSGSSNLCSILLSLPPEIRTVIYDYAFSLPHPVKLRTPSHRRLRPSRISKDDPRSLLETCSLIRNEAVPIFYGHNPLAFRCAKDCLEFVSDKKLHPTILRSISHIAIDDGDVSDSSELVRNQINVIKTCLYRLSSSLYKLKTLEFRFYARSDDMTCKLGFECMVKCWSNIAMSLGEGSIVKRRKLRQRKLPSANTNNNVITTNHPLSNVNLTTHDTTSHNTVYHVSQIPHTDENDDSPPSSLFFTPLEKFISRSEITHIISEHNFHITLLETAEQYGFEKENPRTELSCCNLILTRNRDRDRDRDADWDRDRDRDESSCVYGFGGDSDGCAKQALGAAKTAVQERLMRVGATPKKLRETYDTTRYGP